MRKLILIAMAMLIMASMASATFDVFYKTTTSPYKMREYVGAERATINWGETFDARINFYNSCDVSDATTYTHDADGRLPCVEISTYVTEPRIAVSGRSPEVVAKVVNVATRELNSIHNVQFDVFYKGSESPYRMRLFENATRVVIRGVEGNEAIAAFSTSCDASDAIDPALDPDGRIECIDIITGDSPRIAVQNVITGEELNTKEVFIYMHAPPAEVPAGSIDVYYKSPVTPMKVMPLSLSQAELRDFMTIGGSLDNFGVRASIETMPSGTKSLKLGLAGETRVSGTDATKAMFDSRWGIDLTTGKLTGLGNMHGLSEGQELSTWGDSGASATGNIGTNREDVTLSSGVVIKAPYDNGMVDRAVLELPAELRMSFSYNCDLSDAGVITDTSEPCIKVESIAPNAIVFSNGGSEVRATEVYFYVHEEAAPVEIIPVCTDPDFDRVDTATTITGVYASGEAYEIADQCEATDIYVVSEAACNGTAPFVESIRCQEDHVCVSGRCTGMLSGDRLRDMRFKEIRDLLTRVKVPLNNLELKACKLPSAPKASATANVNAFSSLQTELKAVNDQLARIEKCRTGKEQAAVTLSSNAEDNVAKLLSSIGSNAKEMKLGTLKAAGAKTAAAATKTPAAKKSFFNRLFSFGK